MALVAAFAISVYGLVAGLGWGGSGAAWLPGQTMVWARPRGPGTLVAPVSVELDAERNIAAAVDPAGAAGAGPAAGTAAASPETVSEPLVRRREPLLAGEAQPLAAADRAGAQGAPPPPGSFMNQQDYARAIAARLAREHPELPPSTRAEIAGAIAERGLAWGLDPWLIYADIEVESDFDPSTTGAAGEIGLMQVLPSTARMVARRVFGIDDFPAARLFDPAWNVRIGTAFLGILVEQHRGNVAVALGAYNAGSLVDVPTSYSYRVLGVFRRLGAPITGRSGNA